MIVLGVSGGVDSSVCAVLLKKQNQDVRGVFMNNWEDGGPECRAEEDRLDALRVCGMLGIPFSTRNFAQNYKEQVFAQFLDGYKKGFTPNPDILCNREVKFKVFLDDALASGADQIATGHYARMEMRSGQAVLLRGVDPKKDQSYFLHAITQDALCRAVFPLGHLTKTEVRALAQEHGLLNAKKKDSTGICFIGEQDFKTFLKSYLPAHTGEIVTEKGQVVGRHEGALYYTVGQRAPVGGVKGASSLPWFILRKDVQSNTLVVGQGADHPSLNLTSLRLSELSWIAGHPPASSFEAEIQIRHLGETRRAQVHVKDDLAMVTLDAPHFAAAQGQYGVLYQNDVCLGGGVIV